MADPDAQGAPKPPPNLKVADTEGQECGNCSYYKEGMCGMCTLYSNLCVDDSWVCDSWKSGGTDTEDQPFRGKNLSDAEAEARIRVRAHSRGRQQAQK